MSSCECPEGKWPATNCGPIPKCSLYANETFPSTVVLCSASVPNFSGGWTTIQGGDCHPSYVFCQETQTCDPFLYTACGYLDWLKNFAFEFYLKRVHFASHISFCLKHYKDYV